MTEHTPGPWKVSDTEECERMGHKYLFTQIVSESPEDMSKDRCDASLVALIPHRHDGILPEERKAAARLIASTPYLLVILEAIHNHLKNDDGCLVLCETLALAGIKKATT